MSGTPVRMGPLPLEPHLAPTEVPGYSRRVSLRSRVPGAIGKARISGRFRVEADPLDRVEMECLSRLGITAAPCSSARRVEMSTCWTVHPFPTGQTPTACRRQAGEFARWSPGHSS